MGFWDFVSLDLVGVEPRSPFRPHARRRLSPGAFDAMGVVRVAIEDGA